MKQHSVITTTALLALTLSLSSLSNSYAVLPSLIDAPSDLLVDTDTSEPNLNISPAVTKPDHSETKANNPLHQIEAGAFNPFATPSEPESQTLKVSEPPEPINDTEPLEDSVAVTETEPTTESEETTDENIIALASESQSADDSLKEALAELKPETQSGLEELTKLLHQEHRTIAQELRDAEELAVSDLALLWQAAVERSGTIRFAIEKLSRRTATGDIQTGPGFTQRMVQSMARLGGVAGSLWTGTPAGVMGGSLVEQMVSGDPSNSAISRITDADMLILAKEVEHLQSAVISSYYEYKHAHGLWKLSQKAKRELSTFYDALDPNTTETSAMRPVLDSMFDGITQEEETYKQDYISARNSLSLMVGADAILALEQNDTNLAATN